MASFSVRLTSKAELSSGLNSLQDSTQSLSNRIDQLRAHWSTLTGPSTLLRQLSKRPAPHSISIPYQGAAWASAHTQANLGQAERVLLEAHQGEIEGKLYLPQEGSHPDNSELLLILIPGLGGDASSPYMSWVGDIAAQLGVSTLCLSHRGSGKSTPGFYHAGWYRDVLEAIQHPRLIRYSRRLLAGFSLGGHIAGRLACSETGQNQFMGIFACCSPIDLAETQRHLDHRAWSVYRRYLLSGIKKTARALLESVKHKQLAVSPFQQRELTQALSAKTIGQFDHCATRALLGYPDQESYYQGESLIHYLPALHTPLTWASNRYDPFINASQAHRLTQLNLDSDLLHCMTYSHGGHVYSASYPRTQTSPTALDGLIAWITSYLN